MLKRFVNYQRGSQVIKIMMKINKKNHLCKTCSMRGVRKEINYSEPCSNAPDKAQFEFGLYAFDHERAQRARVQMGTTQTQLCFILGI